MSNKQQVAAIPTLLSQDAMYLAANQANVSSIKRLILALTRERLLPFLIKKNRLFISLTHSKQTIIATQVKRFTLDRLEIKGPIFLINELHKKKISLLTSAQNFLNLVSEELKDLSDPTQWKKFQAEIDNCVFNDALVTAHVYDLNLQLAKKIMKSKYKTLVEYVASENTIGQQIIFFEQWATKGHPYHPCHKTKFGFNRNSYVNFSPEFNEDIYVPLAAIHQSMMHVESEFHVFDYNEWFAKQFPEQWQAFTTKLNRMGLNETHYFPVFIHPWQAENKLHELFSSIIANKQLILFHDITIVTKASLSFRTMIAKEDDKKPHIKLPVGVQSTSAIRTISPASVENGPKLSHILKKILVVENHFDQSLQLCSELCGLHFIHPDSEIAKHLSIIYRENVFNFVDKNQIPIVVAALFETAPHSQIPLFIEIMHTACGTTLAAAKNYFNHYCEIVLKAHLDLFLTYGISLEGHQQNTIAVFDNCHPVFMITRDLGGIKIHLPTLQKQGFDFVAHPESSITTHDDIEATNNFLHAVIQSHLGELVLLLAKYYEVPEFIFWRIVKLNLQKRFQYLKSKMDLERWNREYEAILQADWQAKGLMRMRLKNMAHQYIYVTFENPLRDL